MSLFFEDDTGDMYDYFPGEYVYENEIYIPDEYMDEKWWYTDIPGYMVSNYGRVWSERTWRFLKVKPLDSHGHMGVCLSYNGKRHYWYIHRLMAQAFIPNPNNYPIVRHLNDIPQINDDIDNLTWGTQRHNHKDCVRNGHFHPVSPEERELGLWKIRIPVLAINIKTGEQIIFPSQTEAAHVLKLQQTNVWKVLNGNRAHTMGWFFEYLPKE